MPVRNRKRKVSDEDDASHSDSHQSSSSKARDPVVAKSADTLLRESQDRWRKWNVRAVSTFVMLSSFYFVIAQGHIAVGFLVLVLQGLIFNEIVGLRYKKMQDIGIPHFRFMTWYFYFACTFYAYGRVLSDLISATFGAGNVFLKYHAFASFVVYVVGILAFILNLRKGLYRYQFGQFAWTHMTLLLVVVQSTLMLHNIFQGLVWFLLPVLLVITNDIMGFIFGFFFGKTPLIKLSPKKTWEGFIGALFSTVLLAFLYARLLAQSEHLVCPRPTLNNLFIPSNNNNNNNVIINNSNNMGDGADADGGSSCPSGVPEVFVPTEFQVPKLLSDSLSSLTTSGATRGLVSGTLSAAHSVCAVFPRKISAALPCEELSAGIDAVSSGAGISWETVRMRPLQVHALAIGLFASLIAPFGGFFASGFKRAFRIKDFAATIPGHGGLTDRMDCQILMAVFVNVYHSTFVQVAGTSVAAVVALAAKLSPEEREEAIKAIRASIGAE